MSKVYWDSCAWIAYLNKEERIEISSGLLENRYRACSNVMEAAMQGKCEIVSSVLSIVEVRKEPSEGEMSLDSFKEAWNKNYAVLEQMYVSDGWNARDLIITGYASLKTVDAIHLATAIEAEVSEFHTYDSKLLNLDGKVPQKDGGCLRICKPDAGEM